MDSRAGESNRVRTPIRGTLAMRPVRIELALDIEA